MSARWNSRLYSLFNATLVRSRISDVLRSVAEQNMGGGFCIKAVTRYTLLADVFLFFCFLIRKLVLKNFQIFFFRFGFWAEGLGVNAQNPKLLIIFYYFRLLYLFLLQGNE